MMVKSGQEKLVTYLIYGRSLCTLLHAASLSVQCTAQPMHRSAAWLKGGWEGLLAKNFVCLFVCNILCVIEREQTMVHYCTHLC